MKHLGAVAGVLVCLSDATRKDRIFIMPGNESIRLDPGDARFLAKILESAADEAEEKKAARKCGTCNGNGYIGVDIKPCHECNPPKASHR